MWEFYLKALHGDGPSQSALPAALQRQDLARHSVNNGSLTTEERLGRTVFNREPVFGTLQNNRNNVCARFASLHDGSKPYVALEQLC